MWRLLRGRNFAGVKFRRQHQYGPFVLDFFAPEAMLAIEVDGGQHYADAATAHDEARSRFLLANGITVLRFTNTDVLTELAAVADGIALELARRPPHPSPLPGGEGANLHPGPLPEGEGEGCRAGPDRQAGAGWA
jgi:very-short-patch-repair endonuclease